MSDCLFDGLIGLYLDWLFDCCVLLSGRLIDCVPDCWSGGLLFFIYLIGCLTDGLIVKLFHYLVDRLAGYLFDRRMAV